MPTGLVNTAFSCLLNSVIKRQNTLGNNTFKIKEEKQKKPGTKENCCCTVRIRVFIKTFQGTNAPGPEESKIFWKGIQNENKAIMTICNTQPMLVP